MHINIVLAIACSKLRDATKIQTLLEMEESVTSYGQWI